MSEQSATVEARLNTKVFSLFALHKATQFLTSTLNVERLIPMALDMLTEIGHCRNGGLYLAGESGAAFSLAATKSIDGVVFPAAFGGNAPLLRPAAATWRRAFVSPLAELGGEVVVVPLPRQDVLAGFFVLQRRINPAPWSVDDLEMLETLAAQVGLCLANARLYQQVNDQYEALKIAQAQRLQAQKMEAIGTLASGIAHDFNNILAASLGYTELALEEMAEDSAAWDYLQEVLIANQRASALVQQILTFSHQTTPERRPITLNATIKEALSLLRASLSAQIDVRLALASDAGTVLADATQIYQIILNLCTNAAQ